MMRVDGHRDPRPLSCSARSRILSVVVVLLGTAVAWCVLPVPPRRIESHPRFANRYEHAITRLGLALPNQFVWWDDARKQDLGGPRHVYPRFASRSVAATMWLGGTVLQRAARSGPAARSLVMVTVGGDIAADNGAAASLVSAWREHGARELLTYEFPESLKLNHDIVDPEQVGGNPALTYPVLLRYISR